MHYLPNARKKADNSFSQRNWGKMLQTAKKLDSPEFFLQLNNIPNAEDATANDTRYHLKYSVTIQRKVQPNLCGVK